MLDLPIEEALVQFAVVVLAALAVRLLLERSRVPGIIGLLLLGMVLGPGGLGVLAEEPVMELFGSLGLLYIMFVAGLEIDLNTVRKHKSEAAGFGILAFALTFPFTVGVGLLADLEMSGALLLGAALSSHTLVSYPQVNEAGLAQRKPIVTVTGGTLLTDTAALILLVLVTRLSGDGGLLGALTPLALLALLAALAMAIIPRLARRLLGEGDYSLPERAGTPTSCRA